MSLHLVIEMTFFLSPPLLSLLSKSFCVAQDGQTFGAIVSRPCPPFSPQVLGLQECVTTLG